ncbi:MAG: hypothetical protein Q9162_007208 [Coniocarpon cinnabarinum]
MLYLNKFFWERASILWENRNRAYYLGPTNGQLVLFLLVVLANNITLLSIGFILLRTLYCLAINMTSVESWEIDRHELLVRRAKKRGGVLNGPGGMQIQMRHHEYPYDVGMFKNIAQAMGSNNLLTWPWPFASSPSHESGMSFEENGFLDTGLSWPPPDPDKMPAQHTLDGKDGFTYANALLKDDDYIESFKRRQDEDVRRRHFTPALKGPAANCGGLPAEEEEEEERAPAPGLVKTWVNALGESLEFLGVDDDEEEEVPLSQLLARRKAAQTQT